MKTKGVNQHEYICLLSQDCFCHDRQNVLVNLGVSDGKAIFIGKTGGAEYVFMMKKKSKGLFKDNKWSSNNDSADKIRTLAILVDILGFSLNSYKVTHSHF